MKRLGTDDPELIAELAVFSAADALQWAETSRFTGRLTFRSNGSQITLDLEEGGIVFACSNRSIEGLGRHFFAEGLVDEVDLAAALVYSRDNQRRIGASMVELEILSEQQVRESLHEHNVNLTTLPVSWSSGCVTADLRPAEERDGLAPEPASAQMVLMEAARRTDELGSIRRLIPSDESVLALGTAALPEGVQRSWLRILETHRPGASVAAHYERIGGSHYRYLETLQELVKTSVLQVEDAPVVEPSPEP